MSDSSQFTIFSRISLEYVEAGLRVAPLLAQRDVSPFAKADIKFEWVTPNEVFPTSLLAVKRKLERQGQISKDMRAATDFDQYELAEGGVMLEGGPEGTMGVIPPIVVDARDMDGAPRLGILDGLHRAYDCFKVQGRDKLFVVRITGALGAWKPYAYTNDWSEVNVVEEKPDDRSRWKHYVGDPVKNEAYGLYIDFNHLNGSRPYVPGEGTGSVPA